MKDSDPYKIIKTPHVTEKSTYASEANNAYTFLVDRRANKIEVKTAVEKLFNVKVEKIRTFNRKGKKRRVRYKIGKTPDKKYAIVTLKEGHRIELF